MTRQYFYSVGNRWCPAFRHHREHIGKMGGIVFRHADTGQQGDGGFVRSCPRIRSVCRFGSREWRRHRRHRRSRAPSDLSVQSPDRGSCIGGRLRHVEPDVLRVIYELSGPLCSLHLFPLHNNVLYEIATGDKDFYGYDSSIQSGRRELCDGVASR